MSSASADPNYVAPIAPGLPAWVERPVEASASVRLGALVAGATPTSSMASAAGAPEVGHVSSLARRLPTPPMPADHGLGWAPMAWRHLG